MVPMQLEAQRGYLSEALGMLPVAVRQEDKV